MKKYLLFLLIALCSFGYSKQSYAVKASGGEIVYEWISDSTYRFFLKLYVNCSDTSGLQSIPICYYNPCDSTSFSQTMLRWPSKPETTMPIGCKLKTACDSAASPVKGYYGFWFYSIVTLPSRCYAWRASVNIGSRDTSFNLAHSKGKSMYLEAMINTHFAHGNSSPYFDAKPSTSFCLDTPTTYNYQAIDPNGDSIAYQIVQPLSADSNMACDDMPAPLSFRTLALPFNTTTNPFPTSNTFYITDSSGLMSFTPKYPGVMVLALRLKEYRKGVLIGSIMRDISFTIPGTPTYVAHAEGTGNKATIYPNPTNGVFSISNVKRGSAVEIINSVGQVIYRTEAQDDKAVLTINEPFAKGVYFVKVFAAGQHQFLRLAVME